MSNNLLIAALFAIFLSIAAAQTGQEPKPKNTVTNGDSQLPKLSTYLLFDGNCKEAMEFYKSVLGGELTQSTVGQSPMKSMFPDSMHSKIVNASLKSQQVDLSASDWLRPNQKPVKGNMVCLFLHGGKPSELETLFKQLSSGAEITDPLRVEPFGTYGALNDRFGIRWIFQTSEK